MGVAGRERLELIRALVQLLRGGAPGPAAVRRPDALVALARDHRVELAAIDRLAEEVDLCPRLLDRRHDLVRAARAQRLVALQTIDEIERVIDGRFLVVKGPVSAHRWWPHPDHRTYSDLDVLVRPDDFVDVVDAMEAHGFTPQLRNWHGFARHGVSEIPITRGHAQIDLHWDLVALAADRRHIRLDVDELFDRKVELVVGDATVPTLDPTDTFLHLCLNAGLDGARRLQGLIELHRAIETGDLDASQVIERAHESGSHAVVAAVLQRCRSILDTELGGLSPAALAPWPGWLATNELIDRWSPHLTQARSLASGVWLAAGRESRRSTLAAAVRRGRIAMQSRTGHGDPVQSGGELDWQRGPIRGDEAVARRGYLAWVGRGRDLRIERSVDAHRLERLLGDHEPRASSLIGAALLGASSGRAAADLVVDEHGAVLGALTTARWMVGRATGFPLLLDEAAAPLLAHRIESSGITELAGFDEDLAPLRPLVTRWRGETPATAVSLPDGSLWDATSTTSRRARSGDVGRITDLVWNNTPHGYPNRFVLRRHVRRAVDGRLRVVERGTPARVVGVLLREGGTSQYHCWALLAIEPEWRGHRLSWDLVSGGAVDAIEDRVGIVTFLVSSNPIPIPEDALLPSTWWFVRLSPPRRFRGEPRLHRLLEAVVTAPSRARGPDFGEHREPGAADGLTTVERTQDWWQTSAADVARSSARDE